MTKEIQGNFQYHNSTANPAQHSNLCLCQVFSRGHTRHSSFDLPTEFLNNLHTRSKLSFKFFELLRPGNQDLQYHGPMSMRNAPGQSCKHCFYQGFYLAGMQDTLRLAQSMGIQSLASIYGLTLVFEVRFLWT